MTNPQPFFTQERLQRVMDDAGVDLILASRKANTAYLSGRFNHLVWEYPDVTHCLEKDDDGCETPLYFVGVTRDLANGGFVVSHDNRSYVWRGKSWISDVRDCCYRKGVSPLQALIEALRDRGLQHGRIGIEIDHLGAGILLGLQKAFPAAEFVDATAAIWRLRMIKSEEEISRIDAAYRIAEHIYRELLGAIVERGGMTVAEARGLEMRLVTEAECPPLHFGYVYPWRWGTVKPGYPQQMRIEPGDILMLDIGVIKQGYTTDFGRAAVWGRADDRTRRIWDALRATREVAEKALRPGRAASDVYHELAECMRSHGLGAHYALGHGLGIECHERPNIAAEDETVLEEGMVIVPELCVGEDSVTFLLEDAGVVRADGWHRITRLGTELIEFGV